MNSIEGFILVGGDSRRMGTDKSRLLLNGETFVEHIAKELLSLADSVKIVGKNSGQLALKLPSAPDIYPRWGALGGVHAALEACRSQWAAIVACDLPFVSAALIARLASFRENFAAVAPIQSDGRPQPLCALYQVIPCLTQADQLIKSGERRPIALLQSVSARWVSFAELADLVGADRFFDNINTPQDYVRVTQKKE
jgi:molybdopterin-guanine dinucleotide biosynthesis protein A